jgi:putative transposase
VRRLKTELDAEGHRASLRKVALWLEVPWSSVQYKPGKRKPPEVDKRVEAAIYELIQRYPRYGYRRIAVMLRRKKELVVNRKKVQRIMRRNGWGVTIRPQGFRPRVPGSRSVSERPNERWATDMTHFFCNDSGWCHVVAVIDCWNREIIGYRVSRSQEAKVAEGALEDALIRRFQMKRSEARGVLLRSDNGLIFTSKRYLKLIHKYGLEPEFITPYTPEQNGVIERFMRSLKEECIWLQGFSSFREAKTIIEAWINEYNTERPHQELGYVPPIEYRQQLAA